MTSPAPSRHIALPGTTNFRDLGGYRGHQGRSVRWRVLFRSDHLADLTPEGVQALHGLGVRRSADFRGAQERRVDAYAWDGLHTHALTVEPTVVQKAFALIHAGGSLTAADSVALMQETYRHFVRDNTVQFAQLFQLLLEDEVLSLLLEEDVLSLLLEEGVLSLLSPLSPGPGSGSVPLYGHICPSLRVVIKLLQIWAPL